MSEEVCINHDNCEIEEITEKTLTKEEKLKLKKKAYKQRQKEKNSKPDESTEISEEQKIAKQNLDKWESICNMVNEYKTKFGKFPSIRNNSREINDDAAKVLARWLWLQTVSYKKGNMNPYHIRRLEDIGFKFN